MGLEAEALLDETDQIFSAQRRVLGLALQNIVHHLIAELVGSSGPWFARDQAREAAVRELLLCLVEGRAREAELRSGSAHRLAFESHSAQHLVLDLDQVPRVEEVVPVEQLVLDLFGVPVQAAPSA